MDLIKVLAAYENLSQEVTGDGATLESPFNTELRRKCFRGEVDEF